MESIREVLVQYEVLETRESLPEAGWKLDPPMSVAMAGESEVLDARGNALDVLDEIREIILSDFSARSCTPPSQKRARVTS